MEDTKEEGARVPDTAIDVGRHSPFILFPLLEDNAVKLYS
jgi:hypothetical protein